MSFISTSLSPLQLRHRREYRRVPSRCKIETFVALPQIGQTIFLILFLSFSITPYLFAFATNIKHLLKQNEIKISLYFREVSNFVPMAQKKSIEEKNLDPVFLKMGRKVYTYDYVERLRKENLQLKKDGRPIYNLIPQKGFQEKVLLTQADIKIVGGRRGGGKTWLGLFEALPYIFNPDVNMYGFRKYEDDVKRGIWKSSKQVYRGFGLYSDSAFEWKFLDGKGASMKMEHLAEEKKISDRFRGVEMAYILIEELAEHTKENLDALFALLASNRTTSGVQSKCICTCNPVGKSNKLRKFLDWYIDPDTDTIIPERDGVIRYFHRYGNDVADIVWGNSPKEVYENPNVRAKIDKLVSETGCPYTDFITSLVFIEGDYASNEILKISDPKYMNRISARGTESTTNDIVGVWRDIDSGSSLLTMEDMEKFFNNSEKRDGYLRASADVALKGDFLVLYALDGHHICDIEIWRGGMSDDVIPFIEKFLSKNGVRKENFTYDANGLGMWLSESTSFKNKAHPFNNKAAPSDSRMWNNLKSECAERFVKGIKAGEYSISEDVLNRKFYDKKKHEYTVRDRLMEERRALKRKDSAVSRFEIIEKSQMKLEVGHSPDFIEGLFMIENLFMKRTQMVRKGFENW